VAKANRRRSSPVASERHTEKPWEHYRTRELLRHRAARKEAVTFGKPRTGSWSKTSGKSGSWSKISGKSVPYSVWAAATASDAYGIALPYSSKEPHTWDLIDWSSYGSAMEGYQVLALPADLVEGLNHLSQERGLTLTEFLRQVVERAAAGLPYAGIVEDDDE
jgi:hypothetical protein